MSHWRTWNIQIAAPLTLSIGDASVVEGNAGAKQLVFTLSLSRAATSSVSFDIATSNQRSGGRSALAGSDYIANTQFAAVISAGQTSATFAVKVLGDTRTEADETVGVKIRNIVGATAGDASAIGVIVDDDAVR